MTSPTQALSLSSDPEIRAAEIKAMREQIEALRRQGRDYYAEQARSPVLTAALRFGTAASEAMRSADRLESRLDELENPHVHD